MMDLREIGCEDGRQMKLTWNDVQWKTLVLVLLIPCFWYCSVSCGVI